MRHDGNNRDLKTAYKLMKEYRESGGTEYQSTFEATQQAMINYQTRLDSLIIERDRLRKNLIDSIILALVFSVINLIVAFIGIMMEDAVITSICSTNSFISAKSIVEYLEIVDRQNL